MDFDSEIKELLTKIEKKFTNKKDFGNYINFIKFPFFKNLKNDTVINFQFPLTIFVGKNGCGKSSALQAVYGAPLNKNISDFWFSTEVDPIVDNTNGMRNCFWYEYYSEDSDKNLQVLKTRIKKDKNPDYWETSRPVQKYGMYTKERNSPIKKEVLHIDFRGRLSAFDKCFYFENYSNKSNKPIKDYLRIKTINLNKIITDPNTILKEGRYHTVQNKTPIILDKKTLEEINYILDKNYDSITIINHHFFKKWGDSVIVSEKNKHYSEANAGSGEFSVISMVYEILKLNKKSLILLDEPEAALHPGAQKRLLVFLLKQILHNGHQIILTTHSPALIENLKKESIVLFYEDKENNSYGVAENKFSVKQNVFPNEVFYYIENQFHGKINILVEDETAKKTIESVLNDFENSKKILFNIFFLEGGASDYMTKRLPVYAESSENNYIIFDGDQKLCNKNNLTSIPTKIDERLKFYEKIIKTYTGSEIKNIDFCFNGYKGAVNKEKKALVYKKFIDYFNSNVFFLPEKTPEDMLCIENNIKNHLNGMGFTNLTKFSEILSKDKISKDKLYDIASNYGIAYETFLDGLIYSFKNLKNDNYEKIKSILNNIYDDFNNK